jgi:hypothetical protein
MVGAIEAGEMAHDIRVEPTQEISVKGRFLGLAVGRDFVFTAQEICDEFVRQPSLYLTGTEDTGSVDSRTTLAFTLNQTTQSRRPGAHSQKVFSYAQLRAFAKQEIFDKLIRAIYISLSGTEGAESNNRNEPWYWEISFNRWNIEYHYPELRV